MPVTVWVKRMDVVGARYDIVKNVDTGQLVAEFIARWVAQAKLDVDPSLVTLRLVKCGAQKPSAEEEKQAVDIDPFDTLAVAGVSDNCKLLAFIASSALYVPRVSKRSRTDTDRFAHSSVSVRGPGSSARAGFDGLGCRGEANAAVRCITGAGF